MSNIGNIESIKFLEQCIEKIEQSNPEELQKLINSYLKSSYRSVTELSHDEIDRIIHLYQNGFNFYFISDRFNVNFDELKEILKDVTVCMKNEPKFKPGDQLIVTISEKSALTGDGYKYKFEEFDGIQFDSNYIESTMNTIAKHRHFYNIDLKGEINNGTLG